MENFKENLGLSTKKWWPVERQHKKPGGPNENAATLVVKKEKRQFIKLFSFFFVKFNVFYEFWCLVIRACELRLFKYLIGKYLIDCHSNLLKISTNWTQIDKLRRTFKNSNKNRNYAKGYKKIASCLERRCFEKDLHDISEQ
jgi:hypothetical protein